MQRYRRVGGWVYQHNVTGRFHVWDSLGQEEVKATDGGYWVLRPNLDPKYVTRDGRWEVSASAPSTTRRMIREEVQNAIASLVSPLSREEAIEMLVQVTRELCQTREAIKRARDVTQKYRDTGWHAAIASEMIELERVLEELP